MRSSRRNRTLSSDDGRCDSRCFSVVSCRCPFKLVSGESCLETFADCPICGGDPSGWHHGYARCGRCGHRWKQTVIQVEIENEQLDARKLTKLDRLTAAKLVALEGLTQSKESLLDFGAGSGKFVYFAKRRFGKAEGVEVTPSCVSFARDVLGITLWPEIPGGMRYDVVTAWHVLEHLPRHELHDTGQKLHDCCEEALVVSVPNADSWASRWFGAGYPYRDAVSHFQEFTPRSMTRFLEGHGWKKVISFRISIYSVFCYAQGLTNWITGTHNLLYFRLKRGRIDESLSAFGLCVHAMLFLLCVPAAWVLCALEMLAPGKAACIHVACYKNAKV